MDTFNSALVIAHVSGGVLALVIGPLAMMTRKGGRTHARWGRLYFWLMMWVMASAIILSVTKRFVPFLVAVTVLSFYTTFTGVRVFYQKGVGARNARGRWPDWLVTAATAVFAVAFIGYGLSARQDGTLLVLSLIFGAALLQSAGSDAWRFFRPSKDPLWWWYYHMERMIGSYMAAVTAFGVTVLSPHVPGAWKILIWVGPSLVLTPPMILWQSYYRRKFSAKTSAARPVAQPAAA